MLGAIRDVPHEGRAKSREDDLDYDETLSERLWGLTEMFPNRLRKLMSSLCFGSTLCFKNFYVFSRTAFFIVFSSSAILVAPLMFEIERAQFEDDRRCHQKEMLLGPSTACTKRLPTY